jgi:polyhydroxyalkanoate synthesis repressor PhaR
MSQDSQSDPNGFAESTEFLDAGAQTKRASIVIKKYANRRLYNTDTSTYVTLDDLAAMVRSERDFVVYDARTGEDLTHSVLTQIIVEQESKGNQNLLPIGFLRQLIRFYGNSIERLVPSYLEYSLDLLTREQEKYRAQFSNTFGSTALEAMQEQTRKNLELFQRALNMFSPFTSFDGLKRAAEKKDAAAKDQSEELSELRSQLATIQTKLDRIADKDK